MDFLIYSSLVILSIGLLTSISILSLFHILIAVPAFYFLSKTNFKKFKPSTWALIAMFFIIILSVLVNHDVSPKGYGPITKSKYFMFGFVAIAPLSFYFKNYWNERKLKLLINLFIISSTLASLLGLITYFTGFNILSFKMTHDYRNTGLFGMVMNYAHNLSYFLIILSGMLIYQKQVVKFISKKILYIAAAISFLGFFTSFTRGAWIGFLIGLPFYFFKENKKKFLIAIIAICSIGVLAYFSAGTAMYRKDGDQSRIGQWMGAWESFKEHPVLGVGYLNYEQICSIVKFKYNLPAPEFRGHAHNNFFEILADTGTLGIISFLLWLGFWLWEMYKREDLIAKIAFPFIVTFIFGGLTQSTISLGINLFYIMAVYAISQINYELIKEK